MRGGTQMLKDRGVHPPWGHDAFPPLFQISPYFREIFGLWGKFSKLYLFLKNFLIFIRRNFWWPFLVIDHKFWISPLFSLFQYISPLFRGNYYFPHTLTNFPPFKQIHLLFTYFTCISFPPTFTMMHLCITQCTYWTPLHACTPIYIYRDVHTFLHTCLNSYIKTSPPIIPSTTDNGKMIFIHSFLIFL